MEVVLLHQSSSFITLLHIWLSSAESEATIVMQPAYSHIYCFARTAHPYLLEMDGPQMSLHDVPFPQVRVVSVKIPALQH